MSTVCPKCGQVCSDNATFCSHCGQPISQEIYIPDLDEKQLKRYLAKEQKNLEKEYERNLKAAEQECNALMAARQNEIERIRANYWTSMANGAFQYCMAEGRIAINNMTYPFSSIRGARANVVYGERYITTTTGETKHKPSIGKAVVGGALFGVAGAVVGGAHGKSKTTSMSNTYAIPTCTHIGVVINIDGFDQEAVIMTGSIDQGTDLFNQLIDETNRIVGILPHLARTPMPTYIMPIEQYPSVLELNKKINQSNVRFNQLKNNPPQRLI